MKGVTIIVLSHMYPNTYFPIIGNFVEEQVKALKQMTEKSIIVISPVPWSHRILWFVKKWKKYGQIESSNVKEGIKIYYTRYLLIPGRFFFPFRGFFMYLSAKPIIKKLIKENQKIILHTHTILPVGLAGVLLKRKFKIPHICTIHGSDVNIYPFFNKLSFLLTKYVIRNCDYIVTVSKKLKEKTKTIENQIKNIATIYNGANSEKFRPVIKDLAEKRLGITKKDKVILYIGNLIPIKGVNNLLEAFARLLWDAERDDLTLFCIGEGKDKHELIKLSKFLKVENKVFFFGERPHDEIPLWLNIADILVLPSLSEGFPVIIPEAMMCGVFIIATDVGGVSEAIIDKVTGLLVKPNDIDFLFKALKWYLDNDQLSKKIKENAMELAKTFTWKENAEKYFAIYRSTLNQE